MTGDTRPSRTDLRGEISHTLRTARRAGRVNDVGSIDIALGSAVGFPDGVWGPAWTTSTSIRCAAVDGRMGAHRFDWSSTNAGCAPRACSADARADRSDSRGRKAQPAFSARRKPRRPWPVRGRDTARQCDGPVVARQGSDSDASWFAPPVALGIRQDLIAEFDSDGVRCSVRPTLETTMQEQRWPVSHVDSIPWHHATTRQAVLRQGHCPVPTRVRYTIQIVDHASAVCV